VEKNTIIRANQNLGRGSLSWAEPTEGGSKKVWGGGRACGFRARINCLLNVKHGIRKGTNFGFERELFHS
jgi:hypothetical protein